jgi:hypothetical protein
LASSGMGKLLCRIQLIATPPAPAAQRLPRFGLAFEFALRSHQADYARSCSKTGITSVLLSVNTRSGRNVTRERVGEDVAIAHQLGPRFNACRDPALDPAALGDIAGGNPQPLDSKPNNQIVVPALLSAGSSR